MALLDHLIAEHPVDTDNIVIVGFSAGGMGAIELVCDYPEYFSKLVVMSSPSMGFCDLEVITIPTVGCSELEVSYNSFMKEAFPAAFGADSVRFYNVKHIQVPYAVFNDDTDGNNRSDLVEWMLSDPE